MRQLQISQKTSPFSKIKQEFDSLFKNSSSLLSLRVNFILLAFIWLAFGGFFNLLPPQLPLFFSRPWGEEQLIEKNYLAILPAAVTILFIINTRIASMTMEKDKLLALILLWTQTICSLLSSITLVRIIILLA